MTSENNIRSAEEIAAEVDTGARTLSGGAVRISSSTLPHLVPVSTVYCLYDTVSFDRMDWHQLFLFYCRPFDLQKSTSCFWVSAGLPCISPV